MAQFKAEQLVTGVIMVHEASRSRDGMTELPRHLASALGAAGASMAVISLDEKRARTGETRHNSATFAISGNDEEDWTSRLLAEATTDEAVNEVMHFESSSVVYALFPIDAATVVAFRVQAPAAAYMISEGGRSMLSSLLRQVAANLRRQSHRASSKVREKALLRTLTKAEWRVLMALDSDMPEKQIATELQTTGNTLHSHIKSIYRRLGVQSRLSAIAILRRAEREVLFEELQASRVSDTAGNGGNANWDSRAGASPSTITIVPTPEALHHSVSFIPYAGSDLRVG